jgi:hypothetical protein
MVDVTYCLLVSGNAGAQGANNRVKTLFDVMDMGPAFLM